jgi:hypothetical protein
MSYIRSCHSINAKCALLPLIDTLIDYRKKTKKLGQIGPCVFEDPEIFLKKTDQNRIHTHIKIIDGQQVVAIGDIHGDFLVLLGVLFLMNVIDVTGNWIGNNTIVVLCGDVLDRSGRTSSPVTNNSREEVDIVQYLYALNKQAFKSNGRVNWVLGNHDIARVLFKKYSYEQYIGNQSIGWGGEQNMKKLFEPTGYMAKYLAYNTTFILKVGDFVFLHGGITLDIIKNIKKDLNVRTEKNFVFEKMNSHVTDCFTKKNFELNKNIGNIAWDRSLSDVPECTKDLQKIFKEVNMNWEKSAFVVGHTVQHNGIEPYCEGRVWRIDLGMSEAFDGSKTITKVVGGIKIFQYPTQNRPFEVLSIMNYAKDNIYKFLWFIKKSYNNRYEIEGNLQGKWLEDIKQTHIKEVKNTKKTQSIKVLNINDSLFASKKHPGNELLELTESNEKKLNESCLKENLSWFGNYKVAKQYETKDTLLSEFKIKKPTFLLKINNENEEYFKSLFSNKVKLNTAVYLKENVNYNHPYLKMNTRERAYYEFCFVFGYLTIIQQYEFMKLLVYLLKENLIKMKTHDSKSILSKLEMKINYYRATKMFSTKNKYNRLSFYELDKCAVLNMCKLIKSEKVNIDGIYQEDSRSFWFPDLIVYKMNIEETILFNPHNNLKFDKLIKK